MGSIVKRRPRGSKKPIYSYHETWRVKVDPRDRGKGPGSGKSKVVSKDIYLGSAEDILRKCTEGVEPEEIEQKEFGLACAALQTATEIGLVEAIDEVVSKRRQGLTVGQYMLIGILNRICDPCSRNRIGRWFERTVLPQRMGVDPGVLSSQNFWDHFDLILSEREVRERKAELAEEADEAELFSDDAVLRIEEAIWKRLAKRYNLNLDCVLYDTTNHFTYLAPTTDSYLARTGHNKQGRHELRQVGLALAVTRGTQLPLFHMLYHGRKHDAKLFPEAMTSLVDRYLALRRGSDKMTVVFDKGNNSPGNIKHARDQGAWVVGSLVPSHHPDLCGVMLKRYRKVVNDRPVFRTTKEVFGVKMAVAVVYNGSTYRLKKLRLRQNVERLRDEIRDTFSRIKHKPKKDIEERIRDLIKASSYGRYLEADVGGRRHKTLTCRINRRIYLRKLRTFGKTIIFSDNQSLTTQQLVSHYFDRHEVESQFRQMNDPDAISFRPVHCWTDSKIRVYALMCVLALLVLQLMNHLARQADLTMSNAVLREELADIREVVLLYSPTRALKKVTRMSAVQKKLFDLYNLSAYAPSGRSP